MIKILTWLWQQPEGRTKFTIDHVSIWAAMVSRHLHIPHSIACVTDFNDLPSHIERIEPPREFEHVTIPTWGPKRPQCLRRISMFSPNAEELFGPRFVCMDLDVVICDDITPMFTEDEFRICCGTSNDRPYNGSMMLIEAGKRSKVYTEFTPDNAVKAGKIYLGSDQAWITHCLGSSEKVWDDNDGLAWYGTRAISDPRLMFFPGEIKPWNAAIFGDGKWMKEHYRGSRGGHCLILGYGCNLWDEVDRAISKPFDAVIASPEAAEHWPGPLVGIANTNEEADRMAYMHGFGEVTWCGLEEAA